MPVAAARTRRLQESRIACHTGDHLCPFLPFFIRLLLSRAISKPERPHVLCRAVVLIRVCLNSLYLSPAGGESQLQPLKLRCHPRSDRASAVFFFYFMTTENKGIKKHFPGTETSVWHIFFFFFFSGFLWFKGRFSLFSHCRQVSSKLVLPTCSL